MKTVKEYISEAIVKGKLKQYTNIKRIHYDENEYQYYKNVILTFDEIFDSFDNPEDREEWLDNLLSNPDGKEQKEFEDCLNWKLSEGYYSEDELYDIIYDHVCHHVLDAFDKYDTTENVLKAFGIKK